MAKAKTNPEAKRHDETSLQWRSRIAALRQHQRDKAEPIVSLETQRHADYTPEFVRHIETGTIAQAPRVRTVSSLAILHERGKLTDAQYYAAMAIASVAESIERSVSVSGASMEARVDCSGSGKDNHIESLHKIRLERAYSAWRLRLVVPRRMVLDMVTEDRKLKEIARSYNKAWPTALKILAQSLDMWDDCFAKAMRSINQEDVDAAYYRLTSARKCA